MIQGAIVVTGTSRGIGEEIAVELARRGYQVGCASRAGVLPPAAAACDEEVRARMLAVKSDVTDEAALKEVLREVAQWGGGIGGLVNNAGVHLEQRASTLSTAQFEEVLRVNTTGVFVACREVYPYMKETGGLIINVGSFFEKLGVKGYSAYCASKAAVGALTRCLAAEWGRNGISVLNVAPGYIETDMNRDYLNAGASGEDVRARTFVRRPGQASEIARLVGALFDENIGFLTGETVFVDGGRGLSL
jgi:NAD(P)-dependent dehydrogenase (short-subunit alcohol dehydrogenase family)